MKTTPRSGIPVPESTDLYRLITDITNALNAIDALTYPVAKPTFSQGAALAVGATPTLTRTTTDAQSSAPNYELRMPAADMINGITVSARKYTITTVGGKTVTTGDVLPLWKPGTATTGAPGSQVALSIGGTALDPVLNVTIPRGDQGIQGIKGDKGDPGDVPGTRTISAGTGLTGGGDLTANRTLAVNFAGSGSATTAARSDHGHTAMVASRGMTSNQSIPSVTSTPVNWSRVNTADTNQIPYASNEWTIPTAGRYRITAALSYAFLNTTAFNLRQVIIRVNGAQWDITTEDRNAAAVVTIDRIYLLAAGDKIRIDASQHTGQNLDIKAGECVANIERIGD